MVHVDFNPENLDDSDSYKDGSGREWQTKEWWAQWKSDAEEAKRAAIKDAISGHEHNFRARVWGNLKHFLLEKVFHGKCAYCESYIQGTYPGDAEHYRPKGKVTTKVGELQSIIESGGIPHPGYYWLAYHWKNLLPACMECNGINGKMNQFPVKNKHAWSHEDGEDPDILDRIESPLLLHPYRDNPDQHIKFGNLGLVTAVDNDEIGSVSIAVYNLSRESLSIERHRAQLTAWNSFMISVGDNTPTKKALEKSAAPHLPHSAARLDYIRLRINEIASELP